VYFELKHRIDLLKALSLDLLLVAAVVVVVKVVVNSYSLELEKKLEQF
jgi:hypothetical protein